MLIREGEQRNAHIDRYLASSLAGVAGALNAAAFHAVGFFSANMTGNVSALSDYLVAGSAVISVFFLAIVTAFVAGSMSSALMINLGRRRHVRAIYAYSILLESMFLVVVGCADLFVTGQVRTPALILSLSFVMGFQNAVVTRISNARVRTTHVSGMLTDIGIGLAIIIDMARGAITSEHPEEVRARLRLHIETVLAFLFGGVAGVIIYSFAGGYLFHVCALVLLALSSMSIRRTHRA